MNLLSDIRLGLRALVKSPGFTVVAVTMLAFGIGINATVFTVTNAVLFKGFAQVQRNDRLVYISNGGCCVPYADFLDYRAQAKSFEAMGIVHGVGFVLNDGSGPAESVEVNENSADVFRVVGAKPIMGRDFTASDEADGAPRVGILNYGFWERRYGRDPSVIGRVVRQNGAPMTIIGVMPQGFSFPQKVDIWVPLVQTPDVLKRDNTATWCIVARLKDGVTIETARAEIEGIAGQLSLAYPHHGFDFWPKVGYFHEFFIGPNAMLIYGSMWGAVGFVLLIACANLANLLLARAIGRSREISVRIALGAGRWRIIRQLLVESLLLSAAGGFLGWWITRWGVRTYELAMYAKSSWLILDYTMDQRVLAYLTAISIATGLLFGLAPALGLSKLDINAALKDGGRGATGGNPTRRLSALLVTGEMALAVVLLAGAGVMIRSYLKIHSADMGVNTANVVGGLVNFPEAKYSAEERISFFDRLTTRLETMPGVESVALAENLPSWGSAKLPYEIAGDPPADENRRPQISTLSISPSYFATLRASVLAGRDFTDADTAASGPVAIVNQLFAARHWPGENPLGKRIRLFDRNTAEQWLTVVGVVSNIIQNDQTRQRFDPVVYRSYRQKPAGGGWVVARTRNSPNTLVNAFRREVQTLDPDLPLYGPMLIADRLERFWDSRFYGGVFLIFAAVALLLASIGVYTVIAHAVSQRTQEIGIRMAIGASAGDILKLVLMQGMLPLGIGLAIGLAGSLAVNRMLRSMLVQVSPFDPITLAAASAVLGLAATLGCWIPARRAMKVDPVVTLRHE